MTGLPLNSTTAVPTKASSMTSRIRESTDPLRDEFLGFEVWRHDGGLVCEDGRRLSGSSP